MSIQIRDPLALLPYQSGLVTTVTEEGAAKGQSPLDSRQKAAVIGEPIPIVFCRRVSSNGGVLVSPAATEGRYENNSTTNVLTTKVHLVLSEGDMDQLPLKDVFQRACRVGTWAQTYDRRAETWDPGNFIVAVATKKFWNCPLYCGTQGTYDNMTTLSFINTHDDGSELWDRQVHCFVRNGINVTRILDDILGPSNNVIDLALYLIAQSSRFPSSMVDLTMMEDAALFCNVNGLFYNGEFKQSTNLEDWLQSISSDFLLRVSDKNGKKGLRPRLQTNANGTIKTTAIEPVFTFTEDHVIIESFEIDYISLENRKAITALVLWRQQPDSDIGIIRSAEVRMTGLADNGPLEQYDLSQFCATENHAVKVGTYRVASRYYVTHTLRIRVAPSSFNATLIVGDVVRVRLRRETSVGTVSYHNHFYEVERITRAISGVISLDLIHFPVDSQNRSLVGLAVEAAIGNGYTVPTGRTDFTCDIAGRAVDNTPLPDVGETISPINDPPVQTDPAELGNEPDDGPTDPVDNPEDPLNGPEPQYPSGPNPGIEDVSDPPEEGETAKAVPPCPGGKVCWYRVRKGSVANIDEARTTPNRTLIQCETLGESGWESGASLVLTNDDIDHYIIAEATCPDPSSPDGFGEPSIIGVTEPAIPDLTQYQYVRWNGSISTDGVVTIIEGGGYYEYNGALYSGPYGIRGLVYKPGSEPGTEILSNEIYDAVPIGFVAWRATVTAYKFANGGSGSFSFGGLQGPGAIWEINYPEYMNTPVIRGSVPNNSPHTYIINGRWEFSNTSTGDPLVTWEGVTGSSGPAV